MPSFHAPAELLYEMNVNLSAVCRSKLEEPLCQDGPLPPRPLSSTFFSSWTKLLESLPHERREVTAVISFAWLKADRATDPVSLDMFERTFSIWQHLVWGKLQIPSHGPAPFTIPAAEQVFHLKHCKCIQITTLTLSIWSEMKYIYIPGQDCLCSLWKITIDPWYALTDLRLSEQEYEFTLQYSFVKLLSSV